MARPRCESYLLVPDEASSKYCAEEGEKVIALLRDLAAANLLQPDIFIITPFRIVAQELRRRIEAEPALLAQFGVEAWRWVQDRVGTIHTVQGREAEAVIVVLGAPAASQGGARRWAGATSNIFNVAVSRAKQRLYVIVSRGAWSGTGHAKALSAFQVEGSIT
jgi:superfamily I DNA and/or RNA helicase